VVPSATMMGSWRPLTAYAPLLLLFLIAPWAFQSSLSPSYRNVRTKQFA
jgi:hypothetical protein